MTLELKRGERNHNPLDLEDFGIPWEGLTGRDGPYCVFIDDLRGIRAAARDLHTKWGKDGLRTFSDIVPKFAPSTDHNDVPAYVEHLTELTGIGADEPLDLDQLSELASVVRAFICHEQGRCIYPGDLILQACAEAIQHVNASKE